MFIIRTQSCVARPARVERSVLVRPDTGPALYAATTQARTFANRFREPGLAVAVPLSWPDYILRLLRIQWTGSVTWVWPGVVSAWGDFGVSVARVGTKGGMRVDPGGYGGP